jgi:hypothetical protein
LGQDPGKYDKAFAKWRPERDGADLPVGFYQGIRFIDFTVHIVGCFQDESMMGIGMVAELMACLDDVPGKIGMEEPITKTITLVPFSERMVRMELV